MVVADFLLKKKSASTAAVGKTGDAGDPLIAGKEREIAESNLAQRGVEGRSLMPRGGPDLIPCPLALECVRRTRAQ